MVLKTALFHPFLGLIFHCVHVPLLICPFIVDGHFGCFHVLVIVNLAAVDVWVPVTFLFQTSRLIGPVVGLLDHMVAQFLPFTGTSILFSLVAVTSLHPTNSTEDKHFSKTTSVFIVCRLFAHGHSD